jgi:hypothetical protein
MSDEKQAYNQPPPPPVYMPSPPAYPQPSQPATIIVTAPPQYYGTHTLSRDPQALIW